MSEKVTHGDPIVWLFECPLCGEITDSQTTLDPYKPFTVECCSGRVIMFKENYFKEVKI